MEQREIEHLIVDIDSIQPHPKNVRQGDIGAIKEALTKTLETLKQLGFKKPKRR